VTKTTFTEFRKHAKTYFDSVERGATVQVLRHGRVIAEIAPPHEGSDSRAWKKPGLKLLVPGVSLTKAVLAERRESRA
jgi:antitoxin (DNA-binding transcriptional repressor) of toxin-antitoxin stability system